MTFLFIICNLQKLARGWITLKNFWCDLIPKNLRKITTIPKHKGFFEGILRYQTTNQFCQATQPSLDEICSQKIIRYGMDMYGAVTYPKHTYME